LRAHIGDAAAWAEVTARPIFEVHPELSFSALAGAPLTCSKHTTQGLFQRRELLRWAGVVIPEELALPGRAKLDDLFDAAAVAWSCRRLMSGAGVSISCGEVASDGRPIAIGY
jgi:predicted RNase H-like nuclease